MTFLSLSSQKPVICRCHEPRESSSHHYSMFCQQSYKCYPFVHFPNFLFPSGFMYSFLCISYFCRSFSVQPPTLTTELTCMNVHKDPLIPHMHDTNWFAETSHVSLYWTRRRAGNLHHKQHLQSCMTSVTRSCGAVLPLNISCSSHK
jgi:hypothetical protein